MGLDSVFRKYDSPVSSAEENHGIVMKPAPIMEEEEIEEVEKEEMEDQEQTKKKDLQQTQKPFARAVGKRALVEQRDSQRKGDHDEERGGVKEKRTGQDGAARDESEM